MLENNHARPRTLTMRVRLRVCHRATISVARWARSKIPNPKIQIPNAQAQRPFFQRLSRATEKLAAGQSD